MQKPSVLVIEDDAGMQRTYSTMLGDEYWLYQVASGARAEEYLSRHSFDLIIVDGRVMDGRGWEVLARIKSKFSPLPPVIAVTGEVGEEGLVAWETVGLSRDLVIVKNGDLYHRLRAAIERALR